MPLKQPANVPLLPRLSAGLLVAAPSNIQARGGDTALLICCCFVLCKSYFGSVIPESGHNSRYGTVMIYP